MALNPPHTGPARETDSYREQQPRLAMQLQPGRHAYQSCPSQGARWFVTPDPVVLSGHLPGWLTEMFLLVLKAVP